MTAQAVREFLTSATLHLVAHHDPQHIWPMHSFSLSLSCDTLRPVNVQNEHGSIIVPDASRSFLLSYSPATMGVWTTPSPRVCASVCHTIFSSSPSAGCTGTSSKRASSGTWSLGSLELGMPCPICPDFFSRGSSFHPSGPRSDLSSSSAGMGTV